MDNIYDLHQHTYCVFMHIGKAYITTEIIPNSNRYSTPVFSDALKLGSSITYNKQRTDVTGFAGDYKKKAKDDIVIDHFRDGLYALFKKDKKTWTEEDNFLLKAVADYLALAVKKTMEKNELKIENFDLFHYAFIIPSEWEEEMRDDMIRPIFAQSGLISKEDHEDRLLFYTDIESLCFRYHFERGGYSIVCRLSPGEENIVIKFDLIQSVAPLFNFPNSRLFPKVINSNSVSVATDCVQGRIKDFLTVNLFPVATTDDGGPVNSIKWFLKSKLIHSDQDQIIKAIIEGMNSEKFYSLDEENKKGLEKQPWITFKKKWMLSESQKEFITSLSPSIICAEIGTFLLGYMKDIISNNFMRIYSLMVFTDHYSDQGYIYENETKWLKHILEHNRSSLNSIATITRTNLQENDGEPEFVFPGAGIGLFEAIQYSDTYCKPRIVSSADLSTSSSVFLNSKPDGIVNLDISLKSTLFTCSILNEDGLIKQIFDHDYFIGDKHLPPLGNFYTFANTTTLNIREQFIPFSERYLLGDLSDLIADDGVSIKEDLLLQMKSILTNNLSDQEVIVSTDKQKYIKAFLLMYMLYIKEEILYKLPDQLVSDQTDIKIGYDVSIEAILLNNTMENKNNLGDIIYESRLVPKNDNCKKLRITTQGERILPAIQNSLKLEFSPRSYFLLCQLHEDYVQLSLHQVVTEPSSEEKYQESIIVQDEMLSIQNIYNSLCFNMWYNLQQDNSLIELCEIHNTSNNNKVINLLSSEIKREFFANLKRHIADNILQYNSGTQSTDAVSLTSSCNCKVHLTAADIIDVSFTPVLQDIACTLSASLLNKELFGNYINIDYLFSVIRFSNNPRLQYTFAKILEEEADDFNLELGIDTSCLVVPELFNHLLKPVIREQPLCYKDFKIGALQQVCSENYGATITQDRDENESLIYKSKITDTETIQCDIKTAIPLLNKWEIVNNVRSNRRFYLQGKNNFSEFNIGLYAFETTNYLENCKALSGYNTYRRVSGESIKFDGYFESRNVDVPVMLSIGYVPYNSSLRFTIKIVGFGREDATLTAEIDTGEPLTLTRL